MAAELTPLYVYCKKGASLKPGSLVGDCAARADYITLDNGDAVGVLWASSARARMKLEADPLITVLPPKHRPVGADHVALYSYAGAAQGDFAYDVALKLFRHHRMPWFHPEETENSHSAIQDLLPPGA